MWTSEVVASIGDNGVTGKAPLELSTNPKFLSSGIRLALSICFAATVRRTLSIYMDLSSVLQDYDGLLSDDSQATIHISEI
jgi:hypothetical protein